MGIPGFLWITAKRCVTVGLISVTFADLIASVTPVRGASMYPTFNSKSDSLLDSLSDDYVLVEKLCLRKYKFSHGDVVVFSNPSDHKEKQVKRIIGLPGDWVGTHNDVVRVPEGHCWVEGDNSASSMDSRSSGPVPLGLVTGRATHILWPPHRIGREKEERMMMTGMHTVVDIFCVGCGSIVGWKYEAAHEKMQKYKEGKFILERFKVLGPDGSNYLVSQEALIGGSDADDA
ncbi:Peptidase S26A, signal peptidase I [Corchorus olitorius]|uniref:Mitochondrial inner membrane protease subunit 2 n=1 Tax=Corchorus olitorius TaxID=93759 RepID=A0A1R3JRR3_9ROSI|nr:Peptidase S26A, signal peptidase I [Corchorus olitorius]